MEITQDEVVAARPEIDEKVSQLVQKGKWDVPGYKVCLHSTPTCYSDNEPHD